MGNAARGSHRVLVAPDIAARMADPCEAPCHTLHQMGRAERKAAMAMEPHDIEALIRTSFPDAKITITDLAGDGNHYAAEVIDESFRGQNRVQQQRAVYSALGGRMDGPRGDLHALALTTKAPD